MRSRAKSELARHAWSVEERHLDVEQNHVRNFFDDLLETVETVARNANAMPSRCENIRQRFGDLEVVLNYEDAGQVPGRPGTSREQEMAWTETSQPARSRLADRSGARR